MIRLYTTLHYILKSTLFCSLAFSAGGHAFDDTSFRYYHSSLTKEVSHGKIHGTNDKLNTQVFKGIPYAAPPIDDLRWRAPRDPESWEGIRDASQFESGCAQTGTFWGTTNPEELGQPIGSEDCLYLNVWRPSNQRANLPVFVWIHGGSNARGTSTADNYNGATLAAKANAVVISINFRLGALGWLYNDFLDNGDPLDSSGNYALLDMIKALEWVQENADVFGGNPNKVTIAGNSSGCGSVWGLLHTPLSEDLFHRAICSAGLPTGLNTATGQILGDSLIDYAILFSGLAPDLSAATTLRQGMSKEEIDTFMRSVPADLLATLVPRSPSNYADGHVLGEVSINSVRNGEFHKVPFMYGSTGDEQTYVLAVLGGFFNAKGGASDPLLWEQINADPTTLTATDIIDPGFYPIFSPVENVSNYAWNLAIDNVTAEMSEHRIPVFRYHLDWDDVPSPWDEAFGATHTLDLAFLFGNFITYQDNVHRFAWTEENRASREKLSDQFIKYLAKFMRHGRPGRAKGQPRWWRWNDWDYSFIDRRVVLDSPLYSTSERFTYEEYLRQYESLGDFERFIVDQVVTGLPLEH